MMQENGYELKFEDTIRVMFLNNIDNSGVAGAIEQYKKDGYEGVHHSGAFFRTPTLNSTGNQAIIDMERVVSEKVMQYLVTSQTGFTEVENVRCWGQIYDKHSSMGRHVHPISIVSAIYYPRVDEIAGGEVCFDRHGADVLAYTFNQFRPKSSPLTRQSYHVQPKTGMLLIFPSWLSHYVAQYTPASNESICVSVIFNYAASGANQPARWDKHFRPSA